MPQRVVALRHAIDPPTARVPSSGACCAAGPPPALPTLRRREGRLVLRPGGEIWGAPAPESMPGPPSRYFASRAPGDDRSAQEREHLGQPVDRLPVERRGHAHDDRRETKVEVRPQG